MSTKALMTVAQFSQMTTAETEDYELVEGELIPLSTGTIRHNKIRDLLGHLLWNYFRNNPIGESVSETDCLIAEDTVRRPDLSVFLGDRLQRTNQHTDLAPFAPDIAIEVLSPSESAMAVRRKVRDYLRAGSKEVWLLDHSNGELLVHTDGGIRVLQGTDVLESPLLPGFNVTIADLVGAA